ADVAEMRDLRALADVGVLDLDERAGLRALAQERPGPQVRERTDRRAGPDLTLLEVGVHDRDLVAERGVDDGRQRPDGAALADRRRAAQERRRLDHRVG